MGTSTREATQGLTSQRNELIKAFHVYDGQSRLIEVYTAPYLSNDGDPCTKVDYSYINPTSVQVEKMRESNSTWLAAYDI